VSKNTILQGKSTMLRQANSPIFAPTKALLLLSFDFGRVSLKGCSNFG
jgi:hypothetical protein